MVNAGARTGGKLPLRLGNGKLEAIGGHIANHKVFALMGGVGWRRFWDPNQNSCIPAYQGCGNIPDCGVCSFFDPNYNVRIPNCLYVRLCLIGIAAEAYLPPSPFSQTPDSLP
jgi:hypothetical protein